MGRYRKKPVEVDAVQYTHVGSSLPGGWASPPDEIVAFLAAASVHPTEPRSWRYDGADELWIYVAKSQQWCHVQRGGWIIAEPDGEGVYPCTAEQFEATYDPVA